MCDGMASIDRRKHDIDVMERVLGDARDEAGEPAPHRQVVNLGMRPWMAGARTSVVQVTISSSPRSYGAGETARARRTNRDEYESDRRGEHRYPDTDEVERERPSYDQHSELRNRLEHRG
jgi:hypothetical protein